MPRNDVVSSQRGGAFYRIPAEILIMFVASCAEPGTNLRCRSPITWRMHSFVKALRLTHPRFAELSLINTALFTSIKLEPTEGGLRRLQRGDISRVAHYSQTISFIPPPSWAIQFETFSDRAVRWSIEADTYNRNSELDTEEQYVDEHLESRWPFSEPNIREGFLASKRRTAASKFLLDGSDTQLRDAWVKVLRKLGGRLRKARAASVTGDALFAIVVSCLAISGVAVRHIAIKHYMTGNVPWETIPGWKDLDLSALEKIHFKPQLPLDEDIWAKDCVFGPLPLVSDEETVKCARNAVHALLDKIHASLQCLKIRVQSPMFWPGPRKRPPMPTLKRLHLMEVDVHTPRLGRWMAHMPQLQHIEIYCSKLFEGLPPRRIVDVLDAIRDHPNVSGLNERGLSVDLDSVMLPNSTEITFVSHVCLSERRMAKEMLGEGAFESRDIRKAFKRHLYKMVPFRNNYALR
ncbi:hypothetical protein QQX98_002612 [Neonectria punicea]|uniref:F-box domain-containing protein n=1 Tax=Neonectria punicea TaxID=979145 RepID=A0ABR1HI14_9HYPO